MYSYLLCGYSFNSSSSSRREQNKTPEPEFSNPRIAGLFNKWRNVWLMAMNRKRKLQDALERLNESERLKHFDFDDWRRRYMRWMNHNKTRVMDFFRRQDKDHDGKVTREEFISGILASSEYEYMRVRVHKSTSTRVHKYEYARVIVLLHGRSVLFWSGSEAVATGGTAAE